MSVSAEQPLDDLAPAALRAVEMLPCCCRADDWRAGQR